MSEQLEQKQMEEMFKTAKLVQQQRFDDDVNMHVKQILSKISETSDNCRKALEKHYLETGSFPHYTTLDACRFTSGKLLYTNGRDPLLPSGNKGDEGYCDSLNNIVKDKVAQNCPHVNVNGFKEKTSFWSKGQYFNYNIAIQKEHYPHLNKN